MKEKHKKNHKKEKTKKYKKEKKLKKHKKEKVKYSSSSSSSSDPDLEFKEKEKVNEENLAQPCYGFLDTVLSDSNVTVKERKTNKVRGRSPEKPGQNVKELNPYWKDGGCGLPPECPSSSKLFNFNSDDNERPKFNFLKPGDLHYESNKNTYQRNWKKKDFFNEKSSNVEEKIDLMKVSKNSPETNTSVTYSNNDLNSLAAKLVKAEIMGNTELINKLKAELKAAKMSKNQVESQGKKEEIIVVTDRGTKKTNETSHNHVPSKRQKCDTHVARERVCYFPDDDKCSLKNLFEKEKAGQKDDSLLLVSKIKGKNPDELDDAYIELASSHKNLKKSEERKNQLSMKEALKRHKTLKDCRWCLDNRTKTKHLIVSTGNKCYLSLPEEESLHKSHCIIVPLQHEASTLHLDEDVWDEIKTYKRALTKMFAEQEQDVVFFENARSFKHFPHSYIQCVPLDKEFGDLVPIYFQKAISESETEWSHNKKLIDFRNKDLRRSIPKGLPYFAIYFGNEGGFAHLIEDEHLFPKNFAEEVIGGMMDLDSRKWRKPQIENFRDQREKAFEFLKMWKKFEFNENVSSDTDSSSSD